jgi:hypothetical protein
MSDTIAAQSNRIDYKSIDEQSQKASESIVKNSLSKLGNLGIGQTISGFQSQTNEGQDNMSKGAAIFGKTNPGLANDIPGLIPQSANITAPSNCAYTLTEAGGTAKKSTITFSVSSASQDINTLLSNMGITPTDKPCHRIACASGPYSAKNTLNHINGYQGPWSKEEQSNLNFQVDTNLMPIVQVSDAAIAEVANNLSPLGNA